MKAKIKSIYISLYVTMLFLGSLHIGYSLSQMGWSSIWSGLALAVIPALLFFVRLFTVNVPRTSDNLTLLIVLAVSGSLWSALMTQNEGDLVYVAVYGVGLGCIGLLLYIFWYSKLDRKETDKLVVGRKLPEFELETLDGGIIRSRDLSAGPSILMFYRGNWCPLCMAQIKEIATEYQRLKCMGVDVILVSPQPHDNTRQLAEKFQVAFQFAVDRNNRAAQRLGIDSPDGTPKGLEVLGYDSDTVLPTVILTDAEGTILFADLTDNYRVRPEPETFIEVFRQHGIGAT